jgi:hypothetical protein
MAIPKHTAYSSKVIELWVDIVFIVWQLPQVLLGLLMTVILKAHKVCEDTWLTDLPLGVSFGPVIIVWNRQLSDANFLLDVDAPTWKHERGHGRQSLMLGPFYLLTVGLVSITFNLLSRASLAWGSGKFARNYFKRWPEDWADKLGGVVRL